MKKILLLIFGVMLLASCTKEIEFNGEQTDPKLVINSLVEPGQPVKAMFSKSYFFLDEPDTSTPEDLVAALYVNDNLIGELTPSFDTIWEYYELEEYSLVPNFYNDYRPQIGDVVKITATAHGFDEVEGATSPLPKSVEMQSDIVLLDWYSQYNYPYYSDGEYEEDSVLSIAGTLELTITLNDPNPGKMDYFRLIADKYSGNYSYGNWYFLSFDYDDPVFGMSFSDNEIIDVDDLDTRPEGVFTDVLFDGSTYRLKLKIRFECHVDAEFDPNYFRVPFRLEHLSKEYYNYLNTCNQGDEYNQFFAEPYQTYSNVTNGYGIVAGRTVDTLWMLLPLSE